MTLEASQASPFGRKPPSRQGVQGKFGLALNCHIRFNVASKARPNKRRQGGQGDGLGLQRGFRQLQWACFPLFASFASAMERLAIPGAGFRFLPRGLPLRGSRLMSFD